MKTAIFGSGFGFSSGFGSSQFSVPVRFKILFSSFGSVPVPAKILVPVDH